MTLVGLAEPFTGLVIDCLEERTFEAGAEGGPIDGRVVRAPMTVECWTEEDVVGGVVFPEDVVESRCFVGDLIGD